MASVSGSVDRIVFRNPESGFCVARFHIAATTGERDASTTIVGTLPSIRPGETLHLSGEWHLHPVHGRNFRVERFEPEMPTTVAGIERYLGSGSVAGIGPVTAARIVDKFGEQAIEILDAQPYLLKDVAGISAKRLEVITASWSEQRRVRELSLFLKEHGISVGLAKRIYSAYGDDAIALISMDPYRLAHDIRGIGFRTADDVATRLGVSRRSVSRYVAGIKHVLSEAADDGHVFLPRTELLRRSSRLLDVPPVELEPAILESLQRGDSVIEDDAIYLMPFYRAERGVEDMLKEIAATPSTLTFDRHFDASATATRAAAQQGLVLADKQLAAVESALRCKVSVLTGGPGTGKTSTLRTIITALEDADISYCLCAPTGRAAKRVAETTGRSASTIHRLLEYQPGLELFNYDRNRPLPYDFVIVDEVSMLDILLFYHLLKAVPPESHLLLVGDADQLPSVGPGNVLRDILTSGSVPVVTLVDLFRQSRGSQIILGAHHVIHGEMPAISNGPDHDLFLVACDEEAQTVRAIKHLLTDRIPTRFGLDPTEDVQVISPMHRGPAGVTALNVEIQALLNGPGSGTPEIRRGDRIFRLHDKVMQIRNNYEKDVYNGDLGRVALIDGESQRLTVSFPSPLGPVPVEYAPEEIDELVLAYAVSVHKAQGSEFPCVVIPLMLRHAILLQRNLLYTALTRARQVCVLVGSATALRRAVETERVQRRHSRLANRLKAHETV